MTRFCPRDPLGINNTRTQELNLHFSHSFNENRAWVVGRMRRWGPSVCPAQSREWDRRHMRSPPNDSPGPPHAGEPMSA